MRLKVENNLIEPSFFAALWALDQGIVPEARRAGLTHYLLANRDQADRIMTYYYLCLQLYAADTPEFDREIVELFRAKWKGMAESASQATWEEFDGASKAHGYGMFPGYFLSAYVLGVSPIMPAANNQPIIEPHLGDLASAEGSVPTEFGLVPVSWKVGAGRLSFQFEAPRGVRTVPRLPGAGSLVLDGNTAPAVRQGRRVAVAVAPGRHQGVITFP